MKQLASMQISRTIENRRQNVIELYHFGNEKWALKQIA